MVKKEFYYKSNAKTEKIHAVKWIPDGEIRAIVMIVHGMTEFIERYEETALFLCEKGFLVAGNDHLGHGASIGKNPPGYMCKKDPATILVEDVEKLRQLLVKEYPDLPLIMLGHSMGSLITRNYLTVYGDHLSGVILSGTLLMPMGTMKLMDILIKINTLFYGTKHPNALLNKIAFGAYNRKIPHPKTDNDWLTKDEEIVQAYTKNPLCTFIFTNNGFHALQQLGVRLHDKKRLAAIPKSLPVLFIYGKEDPCGDYGVGAHKVYESYVNLGIRSVKEIAYPGDRHELLNETDREKIREDIYHWIEAEAL